MAHDHLYLPFKSCPCRPFVSCIRCWADETQSLAVGSEVQCKNGHPITHWIWFCFDPVFWLRFIKTDKLEQQPTRWIVAVLSYSLVGILLFSFLLSNPDFPAWTVLIWDVAMVLLPVFIWRYSSWVIVSPWLWMLTIILNILASASFPRFVWIISPIAAALGSYAVNCAQLHIDHWYWYKCYVDAGEAEEPVPEVEQSVEEEPGAVAEGQARFSM